MLLGDIAIALNLLSIAVLAFAVSVIFIALTTRFTLARSEHFTFRLRKLILWTLVTAPWWIALGCVALFVTERGDMSHRNWLADFAHWHHIDVFSFTSWHAVTLLFASAYLLFCIVSTVFNRRTQSSAIANLISLTDVAPATTQSQLHYYSLPLNIPAAFTAGLLSPKVYLTSTLLEQVNQQELDIIVRHEFAHVESRDPLFKVVFSTLARFFPVRTKRKLIQQFTLLTEQLADSSVTATYDNLDVAQTLINVARMQRNLGVITNRLGCDGMQTSHFGNDQTSIRVQRLINPVLSSSWLAAGMSVLLIASVPLLTVSTVDSLHHFIETFFTH